MEGKGNDQRTGKRKKRKRLERRNRNKDLKIL